HEPVGSVEILELSEDADAHRLLRLDELALEEGDQRAPLAGVKGVLPELDDGTGYHLRNSPHPWYCLPGQMRTVGADQKRPLASLRLRAHRKTPAPLHAQIDQALRARILAGAVRPGTRLPSSRTLAAELGVARTTVLQALEALQAEGYLVAAPRS